MSSIIPFSRGTSTFGNADLSNCEKEQIHVPGSIQPHGALLVVDEQLTIVRASQNAAGFLLNDDDQPIIGSSLSTLDAALAKQLADASATDGDSTPKAITCNLQQPMDCMVHRSGPYHILEFELASTLDEGITQMLQDGISEITGAASLQSLCDTVTRLFKRLFGYDRVMVYRFAFEGHGEVFAEQCEANMEPYLGNHYPASDIPQIAREMYKRSRVRMLPDVDYQPSPIRPKPQVGESEDLDMTLCHLRSMSPIHREYLRNMEVQATLVTSLMCGNSLWGLITCHHNSRKVIGYEMRLLAELLAEITATRISALEGLVRARAEQGVQQFEQRLIEAISNDGDWTTALMDRSGQLLRPLDAIGAVLIHDGDILQVGTTPAEADIRALVSWLSEHHKDSVFHSRAIGIDYPQFASIAATTPGVLACPVSSIAGEFLLWFRPERVRTICWGGAPTKPVDDILSPRTSFAKWTEELKDTSDSWSEATLSVAWLLSASVADVIQQFRAMRVMIAHNQLESLTDQIIRSDLPALIADSEGNILLRNKAFDGLLWNDRPSLERVADLPRFFEEQAFASQNLMALLTQQKSWHGSATLDSRPVLMRADAVFAGNNQVLGYVILLTDISDRQMAENARRRFPQRTIEKITSQPTGLGENSRSLYESLLEVVVENAQLAAIEITDGIDVQRIPEMLEGVEASMSRTSQLIGNLIQHAESMAVSKN
jgi:light-regulated signal transduction histidine kinase (bacteriophytochrome)